MRKGTVETSAASGQVLLDTLFAPFAGKGLIEVRALRSGKGGLYGNEWFSSATGAYAFAQSIGRKANVYFGVAARKHRGGTKKDVLATSALWFDLDSKNKGWSIDACLQRIGSLPPDLQPSALVHSGGGLHGYFLLRKPLRDHARIEEYNAAIRDAFSGDAVQNVDRILRVPDTFNLKRGRICRVVYCADHLRYDPAKLVHALKAHGPVFVGDAFKGMAARSANGRHISEPAYYPSGKNTSLEELWSRRVKYHGGGAGTYSVDEAILLTTCRLHCFEWRDARIIDWTLQRVRSVHASQAASEQWDWEQEQENIARKLERWKDRWTGIRRERARPARATA
ncbi:MAG: hypothetical protein AB7O71_10760 [Hyphomicrobiaceae bacterium]